MCAQPCAASTKASLEFACIAKRKSARSASQQYRGPRTASHVRKLQIRLRKTGRKTSTSCWSTPPKQTAESYCPSHEERGFSPRFFHALPLLIQLPRPSGRTLRDRVGRNE